MGNVYRDDKAIALSLYSKHMDHEGTIKGELSTLFPAWESKFAVLSYKKAKNTWDFEIEVKDHFKGKGSMMYGGKYGTLTCSVTVDAAHAGVSPMVLSINGDYDFSHSKKVAKLHGGWNDIIVKAVDFEAKAEASSGYMKIAVATPIKKWKSMKLAGEYDLVHAKKAAKLVLSKNSDKIEMAAEAEFKGAAADLKLSIHTPHNDYQEVSVKSKYELLGAHNSLHFEVTRNYETKFDSKVKISFDSMWKGESSLDIKLLHFQTVGLSAHYNFEGKDKHSSVAFIHGRSLYKVGFNLKSEGKK